MKRLIGVVAFALVLYAGVASAQSGTPQHAKGGLGFHNVEAPLGVRWWMNDKVALDAAVGIGSEEDAGLDESFSHWALDIGVPIRLQSFDKLHFILRPGLLYMSQEVATDPGPPVEKDNDKLMMIGAELEAEYFFTEQFSVSAAHGFAIVNNDPALGPSTSDWGTTGSNFTNIGFHIYVFGK
jgi:hypothetical protein